MGNATSTVYSKGVLVPTRQQAIRQLFEAQYHDGSNETSVFSYTTDASVSSVVPDITRSVIEKVQASRQVEGMIPILHSEITSTGVDLVVPRISPLEAVENVKEELILGLYCIGRTLHLLHSIHRLSHNNVCPASIFRHQRTGSWLLTEDLVGDLKTTNLALVSRATALLDPTYVAPEFNGSKPLPDPTQYPIHARDAFAFAKLVQNFLEACHLPCASATRTLLSEMTSNDYKLRPTLDRLLKDPLFTANAIVKIVARLMDLRQGTLPPQAAETLFKELAIILPPLANQKSIFRIVMDQITKYSVFVHPAALSTKFLHCLLSARITKKPSSGTNMIQGILLAQDYGQILIPFLEECWRVERPGLATILLKLIGRYIYKLNPKFVQDVLVKRVLGLNILLEPSLGPAYISAYPIILKHHLKKQYDVAPLTRHLVKQAPLFVGNDVLRTRALTCLLVHPKIPSLLLKEYLARGLTDQSPQVRLDVIKAIKRFAIQFGDNSGPLSAKCLADAVMGSLLLSMVDVDARVREKARTAIRKLTFVMERKENQIVQSLATTPLSPSSTSIKSPSSSTSNPSKSKEAHKSPTIKEKPRTPVRTPSHVSTSVTLTSTPDTAASFQTSNQSGRDIKTTQLQFEEEADSWGGAMSAEQPDLQSLATTSQADLASSNGAGAGWSTWDDWEDEEADFDEEGEFGSQTSSFAQPAQQLSVKAAMNESSSHSSIQYSHLKEEKPDSNSAFIRSPSHHSQKLDMEPSDETDAWGTDDAFEDSSKEEKQATDLKLSSSADLTDKAPHPSISQPTTTMMPVIRSFQEEDPQEEDNWGLDDDFGTSQTTDYHSISSHLSPISPSTNLEPSSNSSKKTELDEIEEGEMTETVVEGETAQNRNSDSSLDQFEPKPNEGDTSEAVESLNARTIEHEMHEKPIEVKAPPLESASLLTQNPDVIISQKSTTSKLSMVNWEEDTDAWNDEEF